MQCVASRVWCRAAGRRWRCSLRRGATCACCAYTATTLTQPRRVAPARTASQANLLRTCAPTPSRLASPLEPEPWRRRRAHASTFSLPQIAGIVAAALPCEVPVVVTGHSLGRNKLQNLLKSGKMTRAEARTTSDSRKLPSLSCSAGCYLTGALLLRQTRLSRFPAGGDAVQDLPQDRGGGARAGDRRPDHLQARRYCLPLARASLLPEAECLICCESVPAARRRRSMRSGAFTTGAPQLKRRCTGPRRPFSTH